MRRFLVLGLPVATVALLCCRTHRGPATGRSRTAGDRATGVHRREITSVHKRRPPGWPAARYDVGGAAFQEPWSDRRHCPRSFRRGPPHGSSGAGEGCSLLARTDHRYPRSQTASRADRGCLAEPCGPACGSSPTARDDPFQRAEIEQDRLDALAELENTQAELEQRDQELLDLQEEARRAGVPPRVAPLKRFSNRPCTT